jgi:hypothetical protein
MADYSVDFVLFLTKRFLRLPRCQALVRTRCGPCSDWKVDNPWSRQTSHILSSALRSLDIGKQKQMIKSILRGDRTICLMAQSQSARPPRHALCTSVLLLPSTCTGTKYVLPNSATWRPRNVPLAFPGSQAAGDAWVELPPQLDTLTLQPHPRLLWVLGLGHTGPPALPSHSSPGEAKRQ